MIAIKIFSCAIMLTTTIVISTWSMESTESNSNEWSSEWENLQDEIFQTCNREEDEKSKTTYTHPIHRHQLSLESQALLDAIHNRNTFAINNLINQGVYINQKLTFDDETALHITAKNNDANLLQFLLAMNASVKARSKHGLTPLHVAIESNALACATILLENKSDAHAFTSARKTALHIACCQNNTEAVKLLLKWKVNIFLHDNQHKEALSYATDPHLVILLKKYRGTLIEKSKKLHYQPKKQGIWPSPLSKERRFSE